MNRTILVIGIIFLLIGASVVSSTGKKAEDYTFNTNFLGSVSNQKGLLSCDHLGYVFTDGYFCYLYEFILNNPGDLTCVCGYGEVFFTGVTWSCDDCIYSVEYISGVLWGIDPDSCDRWSIGGGGAGLNCLAYDSVTYRMYGVGSVGTTDTIYELDPETGKQDELFELNYQGGLMIGISFDAEGVLYGWDLVQDKLWTIDIEAETVEEVGPLGINLNFATPGDFCKEDDILYIVGGFDPSKLYVCDKETGDCEFIGNFPSEYGTVAGLVIPFDDCDYSPPNSTHSLNPSEPDGLNGWYVSDVNVTLTATDYKTGVKEIKYRIGDGPIQTINGDNGTFTITQEDDADDLRVEYWGIDNAGNEEPYNLFTIDMDQTRPSIDLTYEIVEGNPFQGYLLRFIATATDDTSGMERVEFFINEELQETVYGTGPTYEWEWEERWDGVLSIDIITTAYDLAGNIDSDYTDPRTSYNQKIQLSKSTEDNNKIEPLDAHREIFTKIYISLPEGYTVTVNESGKGIFFRRVEIWSEVSFDISGYYFDSIIPKYFSKTVHHIVAPRCFVVYKNVQFPGSVDTHAFAIGDIEWG